jgi:uncharacterized membrane protein YoaK (UPF0700 family)
MPKALVERSRPHWGALMRALRSASLWILIAVGLAIRVLLAFAFRGLGLWVVATLAPARRIGKRRETNPTGIQPPLPSAARSGAGPGL